MEALILFGRLLFGGFFVYNGINHLLNVNALSGYAKSKKVPYAKLSVILSGLLLLLGGIGVILWIYVDAALVILSVFLLVISLFMHSFWLDNDQQTKQNNKVQFAKNIALLGASLMMIGLH